MERVVELTVEVRLVADKLLKLTILRHQPWPWRTRRERSGVERQCTRITFVTATLAPGFSQGDHRLPLLLGRDHVMFSTRDPSNAPEQFGYACREGGLDGTGRRERDRDVMFELFPISLVLDAGNNERDGSQAMTDGVHAGDGLAGGRVGASSGCCGVWLLGHVKIVRLTSHELQGSGDTSSEVGADGCPER